MLKSRRPLVCCSVIHVRSIRATQHGKYFIMKRTHNCEVRIYFFSNAPANGRATVRVDRRFIYNFIQNQSELDGYDVKQFYTVQGIDTVFLKCN